MSEIYFRDSYIAVVPSYESTEYHRHSMLHVFVGRDALLVDDQKQGKLVIVEQDVYHCRPRGDLQFFLFVDPTSGFAEYLRKEYLKGRDCYVCDDVIACADLTESGITDFVSRMFGDFCCVHRRSDIDPRIRLLLDEIDGFGHLDSRISDIALKIHYSESYLTHLFKKETGVSLKQYLLLRRMEYVWKRIKEGEGITTAALDAGFTSPSHFADTCKKLTGISATNVLK